MRVIYNLRATNDLKQIYNYYFKINPKLAENFAANFYTTIDKIQLYPQANSVRWKLKFKSPTRSKANEQWSYTVFYSFAPIAQTVTIKRIRHHSRKPLEK